MPTPTNPNPTDILRPCTSFAARASYVGNFGSASVGAGAAGNGLFFVNSNMRMRDVTLDELYKQIKDSKGDLNLYKLAKEFE